MKIELKKLEKLEKLKGRKHSKYHLKWKKILNRYNHKLPKKLTNNEIYEYVNMIRLECELCFVAIIDELMKEEEEK